MADDIIRIAVLSDIHSNMAALDACLSDAKRFRVKYFLFLGDLVSDWHEPGKVIDKVRSVSDRVIKGNRENYMIYRRSLEYDGTWSRYDQYAIMEWTYKQLSSKQRDYIDSLPPQMRVPVNEYYSIRMVHGTPFSTNKGMYIADGEAPVAKSLNAVRDNILLFGHTHEQWKVEIDGKVAINPGSVGVHFNKKRGAEYAILEIDGSRLNVMFRQVYYPLQKYAAAFCDSDIYEKGYVWFLVNYIGMQKGHNYCPEFFAEIEKARRETDMTTSGPIPNDIWYQVFEDKFSKEAMNFFLGGG